MSKLEELRAKLRKELEKTERGKNGNFDNSVYPFWDAEYGKQSTLRFLPDADETNESHFYVKREIIKLPFAGIAGQTNNEIYVQVPCMHMYNEKHCPILAETRSWWNASEELKEQAKIYWKKKSYLYQGFVVESVIDEQVLPENPIRRFVINQSIHDIISQGIMDPELEYIPTDYENGRDFKIIKTKKGEFPQYNTSKYNMRTRALSDDELSAIEKFGLYDLKSFVPKKPDEQHLNIIMEMFEASLDGQAYDSSRWGDFYKPQGFSLESYNNTADNSKQSSNSSNDKAKSVLERLRKNVNREDSDNDSGESSSNDDITKTSAAILERIKRSRS